MSFNNAPFPPGMLTKDVIVELTRRIENLERRVLFLEPEVSKYPALAKAYEEYKIIEKLTIGNNET